MDSGTLGAVYIFDPTKVDLAIHRYVQVDDKNNGFVRREKGRDAREVLADLEYEMQEVLADVEYSCVSCAFKYNHASQEIPDYQQLACYAVTGGNEGHYVHVDLVMPGGEHVPLFTFKTLMGSEHAWQITMKAADLLAA